MTNLFRPSKNEAQKTKFILSGMIVSFLLIGYQNCGKVNQGPNAIDATREQKPAVLDLNDSSSIVILGNENPDYGLHAYKVDVSSGVVYRTVYEMPASDPANVPIKLCLSEEKRLTLEFAYNNSSICLFKKKDDPNLVCTTEYTYPYAIIKNSANQTFKLGENAKPCFDFHDICTDNRDHFIRAAKDAIAGIDTSTCD